MNTFAETMRQERRLVLLRCLADVDGYKASDAVLRTALEHYGFTVGRDTLRADISFLKEHTLVKVEEMTPPSGADLWMVHLLPAGDDVARGRARHYGIARPEPA